MVFLCTRVNDRLLTFFSICPRHELVQRKVDKYLENFLKYS